MQYAVRIKARDTVTFVSFRITLNTMDQALDECPFCIKNKRLTGEVIHETKGDYIIENALKDVRLVG